VLALALCLILVAIAAWRWWLAPGGPAPGGHAPAAPAAEVSAGSAGSAGSAAPRPSGPGVAARAPQLESGLLAGLPVAYPDPLLQALVEGEIDPENGHTAVVVRHLRTGASAAVHQGDVFPSASLAKLPIQVETFRHLDAGTLRRDETILVTSEAVTDGAGVLQARTGERLPVSELLQLSVSVSDNTAARLLLQRIGGVDAVNATMARLGLNDTRLYADERPNTTSARDMATLLAWLAAQPPGKLATPATLVLPWRPGNRGAVGVPDAPVPSTLPALLNQPQAQQWLVDGLPRGVPIAHKSGQLPNVRHDAGIVYGPRGPYVIVVLTDQLADQDEAETFLSQLSRRVFDHFNR
jgi:beta-lactamase class A